MNYPFVVIPKEDGGGWSIRFPDLPGAIGFVKQLEDVPQEVVTVQALWIDGLEEDDLERPQPSYNWDPINRQPDDFMASKVYTTREAAELLDISVRRVNALSNSRGLGKMLGKIKVFTVRELENMKHRSTGRPRVSKDTEN